MFIALFVIGGINAQKNAALRIDSLHEVIKKLPDTAIRLKALTLHELATEYMHTSNFVQAAFYYAESLKMATEMKDEPLTAVNFRDMSVLSFNQSNYEKSAEYQRKALAIYEKRNDKPRKADILKLMADNMLMKGDSANALRLYNQAIEVWKEVGDRLSEAMAYSNLSILYNTNYTEKIRLAMIAKKIFDSLNTQNPIPATNTGNIGVAYFDIVRYNHMHLAPPGPLIPGSKKQLLSLADKYCREAIRLANSRQDVANEAYFTGVLAELQEFNGDYKNAYYNIRKYFETFDSIYSQDNMNKIAALQNKQEIDLKNAEIETRTLQLRSQRTQLLLFAGSAALLLIIGLLLYRQSRLRKKNNGVLQNLNSELANANHVKARLFAILSHDLRSPIARLISFLQYRKMKPGALAESEVIEHERKIEESANSLLATMESMLLWSKEQMEKFQPVPDQVEISNIFQYIEKNFSDTEDIQFDFSANDSLRLYTDENYLKAILYNLTSNAVKAVRGRPDPRIELKAWNDGATVFISVTDNGPGISNEKAATFFEGVNSNDSRHGLGLLIIRDLAKAINCRLALGQVNQGMQVLLAFKQSSSQPSPTTESREVAAL